MAVALPAIAAAVGAAIGGATVLQIAGVFVANLALTGLSRVLSKRDRAPGPPPIAVTVQNTVEYKRGLYGTRRIGGSFVFYRTSSPTFDEPNKYLWYVVAYIDHQCEDARDAWINKQQVLDAAIDPATGNVSTPSFNGKLKIWTHLGTGAQTADAQLLAAFPSGVFQWTSNDRLQGVCYRVFRMERDPDAFPGGPPQSCSSLIDGALLYSSRLDSTNGGSGSHRRDNPSTWGFSRNWSDVVRHFVSGGSIVNDQATRLIKYGMKEVDARIDDPFFAAAANISDEQLTGGNAPPAGGQATRYTVDLEWSCGQHRREILNDLLAAGGPGTLTYVHGKYRLYAAAYDVPGAQMNFTQDDLVGPNPMVIDDTSDEEERVNSVAAKFIDAANEHKQATTIYRTNAAYLTQDNGQEKPREIALRGVSNFAHAQRIDELELRGGRQMRAVKFIFGRKGLRIAPHETFNMSHTRYGWVNRVFRCKKREHRFGDKGEELAIITAKVTAASVHTDLLTADYASGTSIANAIQSEPPERPLSLSTTSRPYAIEFDWTLGTFWQQHGIVRLWASLTDSFATAAVIWEGRGSRRVHEFNDQTPRFFWITIRTIGGQESAPFPATNGRQAAATIPHATAEVFMDGFDHQQWEAFYNDRDNEAGVVITYPTNGESSGRVIRAAGGQLWIAHKQNIPYDATALYRITTRIRRIAAGAGGQQVWVGVEGVNADGVTLINESGADTSSSQHYNCARGFDMSTVTLNEWRTFVGYFKGHGTSGFGVALNVEQPTPLRTGVRYFRPLLILGYPDGDATQECDEIKVERLLVPDDADNTDKQRICPDAEFNRSTTLGVFWVRQDSAGSGYVITIEPTGGVGGGLLRLVTSGATNGVTIWARRAAGAVQATTGQVVQITIRLRRTTALTGLANTDAFVQPEAGLFLENAFPPTTGISSLPLYPSVAQIPNLSNFTVDEWQEFIFVKRLRNNPKNQTQLPYLHAYINFSGASGSSTGTIEIDRFDVELVEDPVHVNTPLIVSTGSSKTLAIGDAAMVQEATATLTYTIPPNSSVPFPIGTIIPFLSDTTGTVTIAPGSGVTLVSPINTTGSRTLIGRYARAAAIKKATDTWSLSGDLT